jgi:Carbamoyl-phosphate synthase small chain, CPSase domain
VCFNTSMTGYQEILTDPSYAGQMITFTFPHIGNVGTNDEAVESRPPTCRGLVLRGHYSRCQLAGFVLGGALALVGLLTEAAEACAVARRLAPNFTITRFCAGAASDNPVYLAQRERFYEGLRLAGVPDG